VLQATVCDGLSFDPFSFCQDGGAASEVDLGRGGIIDALVVAVVVVVVDEGLDLGFESAGEKVVLQHDAVLQGLVPALDLALGHRMIGGAANVLDVLVAQPCGQVAGDIAELEPLVDSGRGRRRGSASRSPEARSARSSVAIASPAVIVVQSFQATM
jgi:hypothetical protein